MADLDGDSQEHNMQTKVEKRKSAPPARIEHKERPPVPPRYSHAPPSRPAPAPPPRRQLASSTIESTGSPVTRVLSTGEKFKYIKSLQKSDKQQQIRRTASAVELNRPTETANEKNTPLPPVVRQQSVDSPAALRQDAVKGRPGSPSRLGIPRAVSFRKKRPKGRTMSGAEPSKVPEEDELAVHEEYHVSQKQKCRQEAMAKIREADKDLIDDGKDYGDAIFNVPNYKRFIVMSGDEHYYQIRAATLNKLVERVTSLIPAFYEEYSEYSRIFFMTYRSFATPEEVLDLIIRRFKGLDTFGTNFEEEDEWVIPFSKIRQGACFAMAHWYKDHYRDFNNLKKKVEEFILYAKKHETPQSRDLISFMAKTVKDKNEKGSYLSFYSVVIDKGNCPESILPKNLSSATFHDLDELEIARQLTMEEFNIYAEIKPEELQELSWSKEGVKRKRSPNLLQMIERFNHISVAFATILIQETKLKHRKKMLEKLIRIAEHLETLHSFNMQMAIMSAFGQAALHRLKFTWGAIKPRYLESARRFQQLFTSEGSYKNYREAIKNTSPPAIPFLGVYLTDLTFIDEGNPKFVESNLINFKKKCLEYDVIVQVLRFQESSYQFNIVPQICSIIKNLPTMEEDDMYAISLELEPRECRKKDVK